MVKIRNESLGDQVARVLRRQILSGERGGGSLLIEKALAEEFGTSRGPVRDALAQLAEDGLIASSGRSLRVLEVTAADIEEIYDLRHLLERHAMGRASRLSLDLSGAHAAIGRMRDAAGRGDGVAFGAADVAFHRAFPEVGGQRRILTMWRQFERSLETLLEVNPHPSDDLDRAIEVHTELLRAVEEGDPGWEEMLDLHLSEACERFTQHYVTGEPA